MNKIQVLIYGVLESRNDLIISVFVGHKSILRNLWNFENLLKYFTVAWPGSRTRNTTLRMENMGQRNFKKPFEFHNLSEIFYCGMTRLENASLGVFI